MSKTTYVEQPSGKPQKYFYRPDDKEFGAHSLIPECCITFYTTLWGDYTYEEMKARLIKTRKWYYIPCDACLKSGNCITIHRCHRDNPECRKFIAAPWRHNGNH